MLSARKSQGWTLVCRPASQNGSFFLLQSVTGHCGDRQVNWKSNVPVKTSSSFLYGKAGTYCLVKLTVFWRYQKLLCRGVLALFKCPKYLLRTFPLYFLMIGCPKSSDTNQLLKLFFFPPSYGQISLDLAVQQRFNRKFKWEKHMRGEMVG